MVGEGFIVFVARGTARVGSGAAVSGAGRSVEITCGEAPGSPDGFIPGMIAQAIVTVNTRQTMADRIINFIGKYFMGW
jgi:hypothetical protein